MLNPIVFGKHDMVINNRKKLFFFALIYASSLSTVKEKSPRLIAWVEEISWINKFVFFLQIYNNCRLISCFLLKLKMRSNWGNA